MNRYSIGLDLGQPHEFTGLAVVESSQQEDVREFAVRHLRRFPPGTPYETIASSIGTLVQAGCLPHASVIADLTVVGAKLVSILRPGVRPASLVTAMITNTASVAEVDRIWQIPKRDLVTGLQILLQTKRLKVARELADADVLVRELAMFRSKPPQASDVLDWRNGSHDDLVLAVALACWWSERAGSWSEVTVGRSELMEELDRIFPHLASGESL